MDHLKKKREYIQWFLNFRLKKMRSARLLAKMSHTPEVLERVEFVENISNKENALLVSAKGTASFPFICRVKGSYYSQPLEAFKAMMTLPKESTICVCLEHPHRPSPTNENSTEEDEVNDQMVQELQYIWQSLARQEILYEIDHALDKKDSEEFYRLLEKLRRIEK